VKIGNHRSHTKQDSATANSGPGPPSNSGWTEGGSGRTPSEHYRAALAFRGQPSDDAKTLILDTQYIRTSPDTSVR
jgi:hypothetical protein